MLVVIVIHAHWILAFLFFFLAFLVAAPRLQSGGWPAQRQQNLALHHHPPFFFSQWRAAGLGRPCGRQSCSSPKLKIGPCHCSGRPLVSHPACSSQVLLLYTPRLVFLRTIPRPSHFSLKWEKKYFLLKERPNPYLLGACPPLPLLPLPFVGIYNC